MRALNIFAMITVAFFLVLALFLKPVVMETVDLLSEPVEVRSTEDELNKEVAEDVETDSSWVGRRGLE